MKTYLLLLSLLFAAPIWSQDKRINCPKPFRAVTAEEKFKNDVARNSVTLYIIGGIVSAVREKELAFAKKYNIAFHDFGCVVPGNLDYFDRYNRCVFEHLTQIYGVGWLKEINPNVVGINKYKEEN